jgi:HPt (histidine-containing phosphotransfer) domain-containing protein
MTPRLDSEQDTMEEYKPEDALQKFDNELELFGDLVNLFLENAPHQLSAVQQAVALRDAAALSFAAHTLKGSCLALKADHAAASALQLEGIGRQGTWEELGDSVTFLTSLTHRTINCLSEWRASVAT